MANQEFSIQCVNDKCNTQNSSREQVCNQCRTPIVKRYLKIMGNTFFEHKIGDLISNRFYCYDEGILIDTKPSLTPPCPSYIPEQIVSYLKLFKHRIYLPQIYGFIQQKHPIWLLEYDSIPLQKTGELVYPQFFPTLESQLSTASPLRQLNWFYQIAQLWQPLSEQKVLASLFQPDNLRVDNHVMKIMELYNDFKRPPTLVDLGNLWSSWLDKLDILIRKIVSKIVASLQQNLISNIKDLIKIFDKVLYLLATNNYQRKYEIITITNPGRKRTKNEDSCYPEPEIKKETESGIDSLTIVCDGLGGQKSGEVASRLAISILQRQLQKNYLENINIDNDNQPWKPIIDREKIAYAIAKVNNKITGINNAKKRKSRARMGTTLVMSLALDHEIYLAHVGDSRIYWINEQSCHQMTTDDDLASREVRLGYAFYREICGIPENGSLIQALGMEHSRNLRPHIQRLVLDEDCVFVLCSDGLSDFDRVEQYWRFHLVPLIRKKTAIEDTIKRLLELGIRRNGHDNITIALVYCQVTQRETPLEKDILSWETLQQFFPDLPQPEDNINLDKNNHYIPKEINPNQFKINRGINLRNKRLIIVITSIFIILILLIIGYKIKSNKNQQNSFKNSSSTVVMKN